MSLPYKRPTKNNSDGSPNPAWKPRAPRTQAARPGRKSYHTKPDTRSKSRFTRAQFIAWDGEGHDLPAHNEHGDRKHIYTYCANSELDELHSPDGCTSADLFELLLESAEANPKAINVIFGGSYDMNMILADVNRDALETIAGCDGKQFTHVQLGNQHYAVRFVARKFLSIARYRDYDAMYKLKAGKWVHDFSASIVLWDVIGFFQSAFVPAVEQWLGAAHPDLKLIREGKALRSDFANTPAEYIRQYNAAELRCLVQLMEKVHEAMDGMDLKLSRWDGAGAVAAAINKKHNVKKWLGDDLPEGVQEAAQFAYFGGRIELGQFGKHDGTIYHYDINSAYPDGMYELPQLKCGQWRLLDAATLATYDIKTLPVISCFCVRWNLEARALRFNPFPYRSGAQKKVLFPSSGYSWVWKPEVVASLQHFTRDEINIEQAYCWFPSGCEVPKPYHWILDYYLRRQELCSLTKRDGVLRGEEKIIKLGLNSLYGKTAQRVGYDEKTGRKPPYHNLAYAGIITSKCRASIWLAAMQAPDSVICLATDGIFTTTELTLDAPKEKMLGKWEAATHDGMILVQSGFYWIKDKSTWRGWSRGFDKVQVTPTYQADMLAQIKIVFDAWKNKTVDDCYFPCTRFITLKTALCGGAWFEKWRSWYAMRQPDGTAGRRLKLRPVGTKRVPENGSPEKRMVKTWPEINYTPEVMSELYSIPWLDDGSDGDIIADMENDIFTNN